MSENQKAKKHKLGTFVIRNAINSIFYVIQLCSTVQLETFTPLIALHSMLYNYWRSLSLQEYGPDHNYVTVLRKRGLIAGAIDSDLFICSCAEFKMLQNSIF